MKQLRLKIETKNGWPVEDVFFLVGGFQKSISNSCGAVVLRYENETDRVQINWPKQKLEYTTIGELMTLKDNAITAGMPISKQPKKENSTENTDSKFEAIVEHNTQNKNRNEEAVKAAGIWWPLLLLGGLGLLISTNSKK